MSRLWFYGAPRRTAKIICICVSAVLTVFLITALIYSARRRGEESDMLSKLDDELYQKEQSESLVAGETEDSSKGEQKIPEKDLYDKLKSGEDVNVLFLGDESTKNDNLRTDKKWVNMLVSYWKSVYGVNIKGGNYARPNTDSFYGYYIMNSYSRGLVYDLVVVAYGSHDDVETFELYYDGLLRSIKNQNPRCEIICLVVTDKFGYRENDTKIKAMCEGYGGICIDMYSYFGENGINYTTALDGAVPTEEGSIAYYDAIKKAIDTNYKRSRNVPIKTEPNMESSVMFDSFEFVELYKMTKISETEYEYRGEASIVGLIYDNSFSGDTIKTYINGRRMSTLENKLNFDTANQITSSIISDSIDGKGKVKIKIDVGSVDNDLNVHGIVLCTRKDN